VVEIGAGTGALTARLAARAASLTAIERDRDLVPVLTRELVGAGVTVLEADAASLDVAGLLGAADPLRPRVLCGNLPYATTGRWLRLAVRLADDLERAVFMIQEEVAQRLAAAPGTKARGALTVFVQAAFAVRRVLRVPPGAFHPAPEVTSAVVELLPLRPRRAEETGAFTALVRAAFRARRKVLRNAWSSLGASPEALVQAAARAGVDLGARGETLEVDAFARMAHAIGPLADGPSPDADDDP
jgi:16S rRNA (adenine1518-N6/adenine1519-N6)-dimethyltransferase